MNGSCRFLSKRKEKEITYLTKIKLYIHCRVSMSPNNGDVVTARGGGEGDEVPWLLTLNPMRNYNCIMSKHTCSITKHFALLVLIKCLSIDLFCKLEIRSSLGRQLDENVNMIWSWHSIHTVIFFVYCVLYVRMLTQSAWILFAIMYFSVRVFPLIEVFQESLHVFHES